MASALFLTDLIISVNRVFSRSVVVVVILVTVFVVVVVIASSRLVSVLGGVIETEKPMLFSESGFAGCETEGA